MFMEDYEGFDWKNGTLVVVNGTMPHIMEGCWRTPLDKFEKKELVKWTHNENTMVVVVK